MNEYFITSLICAQKKVGSCDYEQTAFDFVNADSGKEAWEKLEKQYDNDGWYAKIKDIRRL